jgi:hypothetical protein
MRHSITERLIIAIVVATASLTAAGCATVQPWQRGKLADSCMVFDADTSMAAYMTHWQEAREGSMGGFGVQGGGCGCK